MTAQECLSKQPNPINLKDVGLREDQIEALDRNFPLGASCTAVQLDSLLKTIISAKAQNKEQEERRLKKPKKQESTKADSQQSPPDSKPSHPVAKPEPEFEEDPNIITGAMGDINIYYSQIINSESNLKNSIDTPSEWRSEFEKYQMYHPLEDLVDDEISKKVAGWADRLLANNGIKKTISILGFESAEELIGVITRKPMYLKDLAGILKTQAENIKGSGKSNSYEFSINGSPKKYDTKTDAITTIRNIMEILSTMQNKRGLW